MTKKDGKPCKKCGTSDWYSNSNCKQCSSVYRQQQYAKDKEKEDKRSRQYRADNREKVSQYKRQHRGANSGKRGSTNSRNPREYIREWRKANPERARENARKWEKNNREKVNAKKHRRRTRKTQAGGSYTADEWKSLCKQYNGRCAACGKDTKLTADHIIPVSKGGSSDISNIQPLCVQCNSSKRDKTIDYRTKPGLLRWIQRKLLD